MSYVFALGSGMCAQLAVLLVLDGHGRFLIGMAVYGSVVLALRSIHASLREASRG